MDLGTLPGRLLCPLIGVLQAQKTVILSSPAVDWDHSDEQKALLFGFGLGMAVILLAQENFPT